MRRTGQHGLPFVLGHARVDRLRKTRPVRLPQVRRDDQIEPLPERFQCAVAEQVPGRAIPSRNRSGDVHVDHRVRGLLDNQFVQRWSINLAGFRVSPGAV